MGHVRLPRPVTPLVAMLAGNPAFFEAARKPLQDLLGPVELTSPLFPFDQTEYYVASMGSPLQRCFFMFEELSDPGELAEWKLATNAIEQQLAPSLRGAHGPERPINLDVGYITGAKLVLASTKDFAHRLYLRDGIFAEITMGFRDEAWVSHAFTFPDFKSGVYNDFLCQMRDRHLRKVKEWRRNSDRLTPPMPLPPLPPKAPPASP